MAAVVTRASDDRVTSPRTSYCGVDDVRDLLLGVEPDDVSASLSSWLSTAAADSLIQKYISGRGRVRVNRLAGRDFDYHEDVDIAVDGIGSETLDLGLLGFCPLTEITELTINSTAADLDDYVWYTDGRVVVADTYSETYVRPWTHSPFPYGHQNVELNLSWGYTAETLPDEVKQAQALIVAAMVLQHITRAKTETPGMLGGVQQVQFEDFRVTHYMRGRYDASVRELQQEGEGLARSYKRGRVARLRPNDTASSLDARADILGRGRSQLG